MNMVFDLPKKVEDGERASSIYESKDLSDVGVYSIFTNTQQGSRVLSTSISLSLKTIQRRIDSMETKLDAIKRNNQEILTVVNKQMDVSVLVMKNKWVGLQKNR